MVQIKPFTGLRYNPEVVGDMADVTAPPYDVISPEGQQALYDRHSANIVRLILGKTTPDDSDTNSVYTRAHDTLEQWRVDGTMLADPKPAVYAYSQTFEGVERRGFIALLKTEPFETKQVLPHEFTLGGPKADRLALFKATGTILSPIFCLYHDPAQQGEALLFASRPQSIVDVTDPDGVRHQFWPVDDAEVIAKLQALLSDKAALIADGHHRYETAVAYGQWRRERDGQQSAPAGSLPGDYTMAFFTNMADSGLKVYPTHRVFTSMPTGWTHDALMAEVSKVLAPCAESEALLWIEHPGLAKTPYKLIAGVDLSSIAEPLRSLDVAILDQLVFQDILKASANDLKQQGHLHFVRDEQELARDLAAGALVFHVHAPDVEAVRVICESGERMPQKSTYFYPKLLSGLVTYYLGV